MRQKPAPNTHAFICQLFQINNNPLDTKTTPPPSCWIYLLVQKVTYRHWDL